MDTSTSTENAESKQFRVKAGLFLAAVSGASAVFGFGATVIAAKKRDPKYFGKGFMPSRELPETGAILAMKALGWGTLYAFTGCGVLFYAIWKLSGAHSFAEFRSKMGEALPRIPKNDPAQGRTEFSGMNDLLQYLQDQKGQKDNK
ncbi:hypothetical protein YQE_06161, partial [Dendroctonus ponderosae]